MTKNHDYERAFLAGVMAHPKTLAHLLADLEPKDFDCEPHRHIMTAIKSCVDTRKPIQAPVVFAELTRLGLADVVGGVEFLEQLQTCAGPKNAVEWYGKQIAALGGLRRFGSELTDLAAEFQGNIANPAEWMASAAARVGAAMTTAQGGEWRRIDDVLTSALDEYESHLHQSPGLSWGLTQLDQCARMHQGDLIIIAARPSMGKTSLLLQALQGPGVERHGGPVALFSLEMPGNQLALRLIAEQAGTSLATLRTTKGTTETLDRLRVAAGEMAKRPIYIDDRPGLTIEQMRAGCQRLEMQAGQLAAVGIDYLQIAGFSASTKTRSTADALGHITRGTKALAKERRCPVLMGSQLSRESAKGGRAPGLHDLRDSGSIESDADVVMFIHGDLDATGPILDRQILIRKVRNGVKADIPCRFFGAQTKFREAAW
jgi:replicative DNA helicase